MQPAEERAAAHILGLVLVDVLGVVFGGGDEVVGAVEEQPSVVEQVAGLI